MLMDGTKATVFQYVTQLKVLLQQIGSTVRENISVFKLKWGTKQPHNSGFQKDTFLLFEL